MQSISSLILEYVEIGVNDEQREERTPGEVGPNDRQAGREETGDLVDRCGGTGGLGYDACRHIRVTETSGEGPETERTETVEKTGGNMERAGMAAE